MTYHLLFVARPRHFRIAWTGAGVAALALTTGVAWADHASMAGASVAGNVWFDGQDLSGVSLSEAERVVEARAKTVLTTPITVEVGGRSEQFEAGELGFAYGTASVLDRLGTARHEGGPFERVLAWLAAPVSPIAIGDVITFDDDPTRERLEGEPRLVVRDPVEPVVYLASDGDFAATPGEDGERVDLDDLTAAIATTSLKSGPAVLTPGTVSVPPRLEAGAADAFAARLNDLTGPSVEFVVGQESRSLPALSLRRHIRVAQAGERLDAEFDVEGLQTRLESVFSSPVGPAVPPDLEVVDGEVVVRAEGAPPPVCCDPESVAAAADRILAGHEGAVRVESRPSDRPEHLAWADGSAVSEVVGEFTTPHACCQARVQNIQRFADIVRGLYLQPGESVSLNEYVGPRTREKGFVPAGAIRRGRLDDEVGGGVSQFATTIFNAAFFAGLDIDEYRAHSLYFSRYPFGREATISNPAPDLVIRNSTRYPVLVWTSYTPTSITVSMYSTKHIEATQHAQRVYRWRECRHVETDRLRVYDDGREVIDTFEALYRPAEGIDCNGEEIPEA